MSTSSLARDVIAALQGCVAAEDLLSRADEMAPYAQDWTGKWQGMPLAVVRPRDTAQVSKVVRVCAAQGAAIVPAGGRTGLCGGSVPVPDGASVVLSLERMNAILDLDPAGRTVRVQAGCVLQALQDHLAEHDLTFPLMFGARGSCMIGGNLSTNAGGANVLRHGNTRDLCLGIEAVMPDGTVVDALSTLRKNNTGYDLRHLLIGAEGTLGIITAATLKLVPFPKVRSTSFLSVSSLQAAIAILNRVQDHTGGAVEAFEYLPAAVVEAVCDHLPDATRPLAEPAPIGILLEVASSRPADARPDDQGGVALQAEMLELLATLMEEGAVLDAMVCQNDSQRMKLWQMREAVLEAITAQGPIHHFDIAVGLADLPDFVTRTDAIADELGLRTLTIGHLGDGNLH